MRSSVEVWMWLLLVMRPHNTRTLRLLRQYDSAEELCKAIRDGRCPNITEAETQRANNTRTRDVRSIIDECNANGIRIITLDDDEYPELLRNIYSPPIVLFVKGSLSCLDEEVPLAVVGPRNPSEYAVRAANRLCGDLVKLGMVLVSGLAVGIDTVAHTCAVNENVPTLGVLACGQLVNYPPENAELKQHILDAGGALVSELLPHTDVDPRYFHDRNRIISGLGMGTLVVEASTKSGCLLTANHAVKQGRDLFCVPPTDITQERYAGVVPFLRDGAIPVYDYLDIIDKYMFRYLGRLNAKLSDGSQHYLKAKEGGGRKSAYAEKEPSSAAAAAPQGTPKATESELLEPSPSKGKPELSAEMLSELTDLQIKIAKLIEESPGTADEIVAVSGVTYAEAAEALTDLEIADVIELMQDGVYKIK